MTLATPPYVLQASSHGAQLFRNAIGSLIAAAGGIVTPGDLAVAQQSTPNMSVQVAPGQIWIPGTSAGTFPNGAQIQGSYYTEQTAAATLAISASDPSNPRIDTIIAQVQDAAYAGALNQVALAVVTGTPTAGASYPTNLLGAGTVPVSSDILAYVNVAANATSIVTANISNVAALARMGLSPFSYVLATSSVTAGLNQIIEAGGGVTVTLPTPVKGGFVGVFAGNVTPASPVTVAGGGAAIYGVGFVTSPLTSLTLGTGLASAFLISDGTAWYIVSGQQDTGWVALTLGSGVTAGSGYTPAGRLVGNMVYLSGNPQGSSTTAWATVPSGLRPASTVTLNGSSSGITVTPGGALSTIGAQSQVYLDGLFYRLN